MTSQGLFSQWQPEYAARGLPTFPVKVTAAQKKPMVKNYMKVGSEFSRKLSEKFPDARSFGLVCGRSTGLTVLDVDSPDERVLADALGRHGATPFVVRTGSGNFQAWYRHNGEKRRIRAWGNDIPIDQLGDGYVVAPPSEGKRTAYEVIHGTLDDLTGLPLMRNPWKPGDDLAPQSVKEGARNDLLWAHCMKEGHSCDDFDALLDVAETFNEHACIPPLPDDEVRNVAKSAWKYTVSGSNRFGKRGSWLTSDSIDGMIGDPHLVTLVAWLQSQNGPDARFWVADGLNETFGWPRRQYKAARKRAVAKGWIVPLNKPKPGAPVEYIWGPAHQQR